VPPPGGQVDDGLEGFRLPLRHHLAAFLADAAPQWQAMASL
jgi:hypothetical protein